MTTATIQRGRLSRDDLLDEYVVLRRAGCDWEQCAQRLGMSYVAFERALNRARGDGDPRARRLGEVGYPVTAEVKAPSPVLTDAACTGHPEPQLWDDELGDYDDGSLETARQRRVRLGRAARICNGCPVRQRCDRRVTAEQARAGRPAEDRWCAHCGSRFTPNGIRHLCCTRTCAERRRLSTTRPETITFPTRNPLIRACRDGKEPLEVLALAGLHADRDKLIGGWLAAGWSISRIAAHTRSTAYTIQRLVDQINAPDQRVTALTA